MSDNGYKEQELDVTLGATTENSNSSDKRNQNGDESQGDGSRGDSGIEDYFDRFFGN